MFNSRSVQAKVIPFLTRLENGQLVKIAIPLLKLIEMTLNIFR